MDATSDVMSSWQSIYAGVTPHDTKYQEKYRKAWKLYAATWNIDPLLQDCEKLDIIIVITDFDARVRQGYYEKGLKMKIPTVANALLDITTSIHLFGKSCPFKTTEDNYILPVKRQIEGLCYEDPPPIPQIALPIIVHNDCWTRWPLKKSPYIQATGDLILIDFIISFAAVNTPHPNTSGAAMLTSKGPLRTKQFTVGDVGLWKGEFQLPHNLPLHLLLQAESFTFKTNNEKNGRMVKNIHHEHFAYDLCPRKSLTRRIHRILTNGRTKESYICGYRLAVKDPFTKFMPTDIIFSMWLSASTLKLHHSGINPDLVGVHSLWAGGAMSPKIQEENDTTIMKMGRWPSLRFLIYIHKQIGHISKGMAQKMSRPIPFLNIATIEA